MAPFSGQFHFIVNPRAGGTNSQGLLGNLVRRLQQQGHATVIHTTTHAGHARQIAASLPNSTPVAVAVGGDGTVREAAQGLMGRKIPLAVVPVGTENLFAKEFGIKPTVACLYDILISGQEHPLDVGLANGNIFLVVNGIGFDAQVVHQLTRRRGAHIGKLDYFWPLWRTFWNHQFPRIMVHVDARPVFEGRGFVLVGNLRRYAMGLNVLKNADGQDGRLDVCIFPCTNRWQLAGHALMTMLRRQEIFSVYTQAQDILIASQDPDVPFQIDGDVGGTLPVHVKIVSHALAVLTPPGADGKHRNDR